MTIDKVDLSSTTKGLGLPTMTTTQRTAIAAPAAGMIIYNSTTNKIETYNGSSWVASSSVTSGSDAYGHSSSAPTDSVYVDASGNVGIGIIAPNVPLHIKSGNSNASLLTMESGSDRFDMRFNTSDIIFDLDPSNSIALSDFVWNSDGSEVMRLTSDGKVKVAETMMSTSGTTTVIENTNTERGVYDIIKFIGQGYSSGKINYSFDTAGQFNTSSSGLRFVMAGTQSVAMKQTGMEVKDTGMFMFSSDGNPAGAIDTGIGRNAAGVIEVNNGTAGVLRDINLRSINPSGGNVGIGTTSQDGLLTLKPINTNKISIGDVSTEFSATGLSDITNGIAFERSANGYTGGLFSYGDKTGSQNLAMMARTELGFFVNSTKKMSILENGNIGIGTTSPLTKLDIMGTSNGDEDLLTLRGVQTGAGYTGLLFLNGGNPTNTAAIRGTTAGEAGGGRALTFWGITNPGSNTLVERMRVNSTGNVGIGTSTPEYKLDVSGEINMTAESSLRFGGTSVCTSTGCTSSSDLRLKEEIRPLEDSLDKILALKAVDYYFINKEKYDESKHLGFIAQDLQKEFPEVVKEDHETGYLSVAYSHLVAPIVNAIQELFGLEEKNRKEIASLKAENKKLKMRLKKVEEALGL